MAWMTRMLFKGKVVTQREHEAALVTITKQTETIANLLDQNKVMLESQLPAVNSVMSALKQAAER